jgi:DNA-binding CsgD family transcriptional regulator
MRAGSKPRERTREELKRIPVRRGQAGLTVTEEEIARLAAAGLTNPQIAERAFVSQKTVQANLTRVYGKLGVHSRTQLFLALSERDRQQSAGPGPAPGLGAARSGGRGAARRGQDSSATLNPATWADATAA